MTWDAVLFDLDGTLTDPALGITNSISHALVRLGHPGLDVTELRRFIGPPLHETFTSLGLDPFAAVEAYREHFVPIGLFENELIPGIVEVLDALDGVPLAIASSKPEPFVHQIAEHFGIAHHFVTMAGAGLDGTGTDKAEVIAVALSRLGVAPGPAVAMIGDRRHDVEGARAHRLTPIGVAWGFADPGELDGVAVAQSPASLTALLTAGPPPHDARKSG